MKKWVTKNKYAIYQLVSKKSNVFAICNGRNLIIIDTSIKQCWEELTNTIDYLVPNKKKIKALIITHAHSDHVENASDLINRYGIKVISHKNNLNYLMQGKNQSIEGTSLLGRILAGIMTKSSKKSTLDYQPIKTNIQVNSKFDLRPMGFNAYLLYTPGHTEGDLSVIVDNEIAIVGDVMFGIFKHSIYPTFATNKKELIESWKKLLNTGCNLFLPSHGSENKREVVLKQYKKYSKK